MSWLGYKKEKRGPGTAKAKGLSAVSPLPVEEIEFIKVNERKDL
jgi:hypothetical protein